MKTMLKSYLFIFCVIFSISTQILNVHCQYEDDAEWDPSIPSNPIEQILALLNPSSMNNSSQLTLPQLLQQFQSLFSFIRPFLTSEQFLNSLPKVNLSAQCMNKTVTYINALRSGEEWALKVMDSWGKPSSGVLQGSLIWIGEYSQCLQATNLEKSWETKYCIIKNPPVESALLFSLVFRYGICISQNCDEYDVVELINMGIEALKFSFSQTSLSPIAQGFTKITTKSVDCKAKKSYDAAAIIVLTLISLILFVILVASFYDGIREYIRKKNTLEITVTDDPEKNHQVVENETEKNSSIWIEILLSFSALRNAKKVFYVNKNADQFKCLHAIRFLSLAWVIYGHTYLNISDITDNINVVGKWTSQFLFLLIINGTFSVDTFFVLSGFLTSYLFLKEVNKPNSKLTFLLMFKYYFHRAWRLTPPYFILLLFTAFVSAYIGTGPFYPNSGLEPSKCKGLIWTNILYINNFFPGNRTCHGVSWYLANDMQFHWIAPLVLIPFALNKKYIGLTVSILLLITTFLCNSLILNANPGWEAINQDPLTSYRVFTNIYIKPWCRIGPFVVGLLLGYIIFVQKTFTKYPKIDYRINIIAWILALGLCALMIFGLHPDYTGDRQLPRVALILYSTFSRTVWACGIAYMIYACITSNGGIIDKILSHRYWIPLSRLTYSAYLIHMPLNRYFVVIMEHPLRIQHSTIFMMFLSNITIAYGSAFLWHICFEISFINLEKFIFKSKKH